MDSLDHANLDNASGTSNSIASLLYPQDAVDFGIEQKGDINDDIDEYSDIMLESLNVSAVEFLLEG